MTDIDITEDMKSGNVELVAAKAREMYKVEMQIAKLEKDLKEAQKRYDQISKEELPALCEQELTVDELMFDNGYKLIIKDILAGSIPTKSAIAKCKEEERRESMIERREACFKWLKNNGADSLIQSNFLVNVPKGEESQDKVKNLVALCNKLGLTGSVDENVHYQTLNSFLREIAADDTKDVPFDIFEIYTGKQAVIKKPKKK